MPLTGHTLELMCAALLELESGPDHQVAQCAGHEHVVRRTVNTASLPSEASTMPASLKTPKHQEWLAANDEPPPL